MRRRQPQQSQARMRQVQTKMQSRRRARVDPASMTVAQLKEELADRGLPVQGRKPELVARLAEALAVRLLATCQSCCLLERPLRCVWL